MEGRFQRRGLRKAAEALGGEVQLRRFLEVPSSDLYDWLRGQAPVPEAVFRKVVLLLADIEDGRMPAENNAPAQLERPVVPRD